jgi:DNA gyrase subunit B
LLLTFMFRHLRPLVENGCIYIAQPPLFRVQQKKKVRYVDTHENMMRELLELGLDGSAMRVDSDGTVFEGDHMRKVVSFLMQLEEPLATLDHRGVDLRHLSANFATDEGLLPRYRLYLGRDLHWFNTKEEMDTFVAQEEEKRGHALHVADDAVTAAAKADARPDGEEDPAQHTDNLQITDLHEIRTINDVLKQLKDFGITLKDLVPAANRSGEPYYPFAVENEDGVSRIGHLRDLVPTLRKMGERGLRITRFKGLGEMDPEELWETSLDPDNRILLQVTMEDAAAADEMFRVLMGDHVEPRREFIEKHALDVKELDV